ncbi:MAG TPA: NAD(P)H-dependent glycerol-3-phosphate dehydrogenase [Kofleriaceae bacterium]
MSKKPADVAVIGGGSYGTCLAIAFGKSGHNVCLYNRNPESTAKMQAERENTAYLPGHKFPDTVTVSSDLESSIRGKKFVLGVTPSHGIRDVFARAHDWMDPDAIVINASKGLEDGTLQTIDKVYADILPERIAKRATYLSGPTFASELAAGYPAAVVLAGRDAETTIAAQETLSDINLRIYSTDDVAGVLLGGALKNVIAIGAGISDGLGFGANTRIMLITRGLAEIIRIGVAMGAHAQTFAGLSGMGDLVLTCSGDSSRNRRVGLALGQGKKMPDILADMRQVAEGVKTTRVAKQLTEKMGIDAPITNAMYAIIHEGVPVRDAIAALLGRPARSERE